MKGILEFNLEDFEEKRAHLRAVKADKAYNALYDITQKLRTIRKYAEFENKETEDFFEKLDEELIRIISDNNIDLSEEF